MSRSMRLSSPESGPGGHHEMATRRTRLICFTALLGCPPCTITRRHLPEPIHPHRLAVYPGRRRAHSPASSGERPMIVWRRRVIVEITRLAPHDLGIPAVMGDERPGRRDTAGRCGWIGSGRCRRVLVPWRGQPSSAVKQIRAGAPASPFHDALRARFRARIIACYGSSPGPPHSLFRTQNVTDYCGL